MNSSKPAYDAIKGRDLTALRKLLEKQPEIVEGITPFGLLLHVAAQVGDEQILDLLIRFGCDIEARGGVLGGTALNEAASDGQLEVVKSLLRRGAKTDVSEPECNPLFSAIYRGNIEIVKLLVEHGIDTSIAYTGRSMKSMDALAFAVERGQAKIAEYLRSQQASK